MFKKNIFLLSLFFLTSCKVVFITGYDRVVDDTATKLKHDYNVFFAKLSRTIRDEDPNNQKHVNFLDYYDNMEADLRTLEDRTISLPEKKSDQVKSQIKNIKLLMIDFMDAHKKGFKDLSDTVKDDHHDAANNINIALNALLKTQEVLKTTGE
jgi:hypothetical protein